MNKDSNIGWDEYFFGLVDVIKQKSKDPDTKVGCIIVGKDHEIRTTGFNGFARGVDEHQQERWVRPEKYFWVEHAERNAIYNAVRCGVSLEGCTAYIEIFPCIECAKALIQSGIKIIKVRFEKVQERKRILLERGNEFYENEFKNMIKIQRMFFESGVEYVEVR
jgi:dCMP deaminase